MGESLLDRYRREWPRVAAVQGMALGGASLVLGRKKMRNRRALAVMNAMTMCAHQYEEYVDPGYLPGLINVGLFKSEHPHNYPYNPNSAMCANICFRALYVPAMLFPKNKALGLAPALLGIGQGIGHVFVIPPMVKAKYPYSPGALTAGLLHIPIGICYIGALRAEGPIGKSTWIKSLGILGLFLALGVAFPNVSLKDKDSPYRFTDHQLGPFEPDATGVEAAASESETPS